MNEEIAKVDRELLITFLRKWDLAFSSPPKKEINRMRGTHIVR